MNALLQRVYHAQSLEEGREFQELADYEISEVLTEVAVYLQENDFVSVNDRLPVFERDYDYTDVHLILVIKTDSGRLRTIPGRYERTVLRGKRVERWVDNEGRKLYDPVVYWRPYPDPPEIVE